MVSESIRSILSEHAKLSCDISGLHDDADLYDAGLTSLNTVNVMLALEEEFDVEFDDEMLVRSTFQSVSSLADAIEQLRN